MIEWNEKYKIGINTIDQQHEKWLGLMNRLLIRGSSTLETFNEMNAYAEYHLAYEEKLFAELGYPETPAHLAQHAEFKLKITQYQNNFKNGKAPPVNVLLSEMQRWLVQHICVEDKKYVEFFKSKGVV